MTGLQEFAENVWIVDGPLVYDMGLLFTTRMTVVRLSSGEVWVDSPVPVSYETLQRISALGPVAHLVAATPRHGWRLVSWHTLFPEAKLWSCRPTLVSLRPKGLPLAGILDDDAPEAWADDMQQLVFKGNPGLSEVLFFHKKARTLMLDDLIQSNPPLEGKPLRNAIFKLEEALAPRSGVGLDMRLTFFNHDLARQSLEKVLAWDFDKLIIAHGACVEKDAKQYVEAAFRWLAR